MTASLQQSFSPDSRCSKRLFWSTWKERKKRRSWLSDQAQKD